RVWFPARPFWPRPSPPVGLCFPPASGPAGAASGLLLATLVSGTVALTATSRLLGVSLRELLDTLGAPAGAALLMAAAVLALRHALDATPGLIELIVLVGFGGIVYTAALWLLGRERWRELVATARDVL